MQERTCEIHFEQIVSRDDNNQVQCKACFENECFERMIKLEKAIILSQKILNQSEDNNEIIKISKTIHLMNKYKLSLPGLFNERRKQNNKQEEQKYRQFNYKLINEYPNIFCCFSLVLNSDSTRLFIGQSYNILVYEFKNGELKNQLQIIKQDISFIHCLIYMNKSNLLVSGCNKSIVIWDQDQKGSWKLQQVLEGHYDQIHYLLNNVGEDLLISGSFDRSIKFWRKTKILELLINYLNIIQSYLFKFKQIINKVDFMWIVVKLNHSNGIEIRQIMDYIIKNKYQC